LADNFLKLNDDKTELLLIANPKRLVKTQKFKLLVGDNAVKPSACARNVGVNIVSTLSFKTFIKMNAASAMYHIRTLGEVASRLCTSLVISRLLYCNDVLSGVPKYSMQL